MVEQGYWQQLQQGLNRRRVLGGTLAGGVGLAALAAGCGSGSKTPPSHPSSVGVKPSGSSAAGGAAITTVASTPQPKRGGTITDSRYQVLTGRTMDPDTNTPTSNKSRRLWYQGMLGYNLLTLAVEPELAQKWEQPDQSTYVFHLQPAVKWHNKPPANGRALTADDVVFGLNRARTPKPQFFNASLLESVDQLTAPDQATVRLTTKRPDAVLLGKLGSDGLFILNPEVVAKAQKFATADEVVGTGAFVLKTLEDRVGADSVKNPDYWKPGLPYMDGFNFKFFGDDEQGYAALVAKQIDLEQVAGNHKKDYLSRLPKGPQPYEAKDDIAGNSWQMPNTKAAPMNDPRVPRALRLLTDYEELRTAHGLVWFANAEYGSIFPTILDKYDLTPDEYSKLIFWLQPKDAAIKQALDLLSAAGYSKDKPLTFETQVHVNSGDQKPTAQAQLIQAEWRKNGQGAVETTLKILDGAQATKARSQRSFVFGMFNDAGAFSDPDPWLTQIFQTNGSRNYSGFSDPEIDGMIAKQGQIFDPAQRQALVKQIVQLMADRSPMVQTLRVFFLDGVSDRVHDYTPETSVTSGRQYEHVWLAS